MTNLVPFRQLLEKKCGLVFPHEKAALLETGILNRMEACGISSATDYLFRLAMDRAEFGRLIDLLTINETYFLREPVHFSLLAARIVPELLVRKTCGGRLKILSAGCSTGEEAYSAVISLAERFGREALGRISVLGVDIDSTVISSAREGFFGKRSFRDFPEGLLSRYFEASPSGRYRILDWIRASVEFLPLNLLGDDYPPAMGGVDVIFYRNVSIYFSQDVRNEIFARLAKILNQGGYLIVSPSETFFYNKGLLSLVPLDGAFVYRNESPGTAVSRKTPVPGRVSVTRRNCVPPGPPAVPGGTKAAGHSPFPQAGAHHPSSPATLRQRDGVAPPSLDTALELFRSKEYEAALRFLERLPEQASEAARARTLTGSILLNLSRLDEARASFLSALDADGFSLEATLCLGIIARMVKDGPEALKRFREAVYIRPSCWPAHYYLAETYLEQGETALARREYEVILKLMEKGDFFEHGISFLPLSFSAVQLETLCRRKLLQVKGVSNGD